ncbi:hypothetical protein [Nocardia carnea]|uniref:hypothetical protein n=1 Tax=Nocardia carnea TaxID=37328 RepID=UPI00245676F8|nr:hypothetical protein [Nocardia carnea]
MRIVRASVICAIAFVAMSVAAGAATAVTTTPFLAAAMTAALIARGVPDPTAALASELGVLAFKRGYAEWSEGDQDAEDGVAGYILRALDELREASASLG